MDARWDRCFWGLWALLFLVGLLLLLLLWLLVLCSLLGFPRTLFPCWAIITWRRWWWRFPRWGRGNPRWCW